MELNPHYPQLPYNRDDDESSDPSEPVYDEDSSSEDGFQEDARMCYLTRTVDNQKCVMYDDAIYDMFQSLHSSVMRIIMVLYPVVQDVTFRNMVKFAKMLVNPSGAGVALIDTGLLCVEPFCVGLLDQMALDVEALTQFSPVFTNEQFTSALRALYLIFVFAEDVLPEEFEAEIRSNDDNALPLNIRPHELCERLKQQIQAHFPAVSAPAYMADMVGHDHCRLMQYGHPDVWETEEGQMQAE